MQLSLLAPGLIGLAVALAGVAYAHWLARSRKSDAPTEDNNQIAFVFNAPIVPTDQEGVVRAGRLPQESARVH